MTVAVPVGPARVRLVAEHDRYREGESFRDVQTDGPFALWEHTHRVEPAGDGSSYLEDRIRYALPMGAVGTVRLEAHSGTTRMVVSIRCASEAIAPK